MPPKASSLSLTCSESLCRHRELILLPAPPPTSSPSFDDTHTFIIDIVQTVDHFGHIPGVVIQNRHDDLGLGCKGDDGDTNIDLKAEDL